MARSRPSLAWSGRDWRMPVWRWVGLATMFFGVLHIILDFGVGLFDLHGRLSLPEAMNNLFRPRCASWWSRTR